MLACANCQQTAASHTKSPAIEPTTPSPIVKTHPDIRSSGCPRTDTCPPSSSIPSALAWPNHDVPWMSPLMCLDVPCPPSIVHRLGPLTIATLGRPTWLLNGGWTDGWSRRRRDDKRGVGEWASGRVDEIAPHAPGSARGSASLTLRKMFGGVFPESRQLRLQAERRRAPVPPSPPGARTEDCITSLPIGFWAVWSRPIDAEPLLGASRDLGHLMRGASPPGPEG